MRQFLLYVSSCAALPCPFSPHSEFVRLGEMVDEHSPPLRTLWAMTASEEDEPVQC